MGDYPKQKKERKGRGLKGTLDRIFSGKRKRRTPTAEEALARADEGDVTQFIQPSEETAEDATPNDGTWKPQDASVYIRLGQRLPQENDASPTENSPRNVDAGKRRLSHEGVQQRGDNATTTAAPLTKNVEVENSSDGSDLRRLMQTEDRIDALESKMDDLCSRLENVLPLLQVSGKDGDAKPNEEENRDERSTSPISCDMCRQREAGIPTENADEEKEAKDEWAAGDIRDSIECLLEKLKEENGGELPNWVLRQPGNANRQVVVVDQCSDSPCRLAKQKTQPKEGCQKRKEREQWDTEGIFGKDDRAAASNEVEDKESNDDELLGKEDERWILQLFEKFQRKSSREKSEAIRGLFDILRAMVVGEEFDAVGVDHGQHQQDTKTTKWQDEDTSVGLSTHYSLPYSFTDSSDPCVSTTSSSDSHSSKAVEGVPSTLQPKCSRDGEETNPVDGFFQKWSPLKVIRGMYHKQVQHTAVPEQEAENDETAAEKTTKRRGHQGRRTMRGTAVVHRFDGTATEGDGK